METSGLPYLREGPGFSPGLSPQVSPQVSPVVSPRPRPRPSPSRRERWRQQSVNGAFNELRRLLPVHPPDRKLSKNQILRQALRYIGLLDQVLQDQKGVGLGDQVETPEDTWVGSRDSEGQVEDQYYQLLQLIT